MSNNARSREIFAGLTTFLTMSYIVIVNPSILSTEGTGLQFSGVLTATVLTAFFNTLLMGLYAKLPYAVAPGMGLNAFFTYTILLEKQVPWPTAFGVVVWAGVLFLAVSLTGWREKIARAIPRSLRLGAAAGIGGFLAFIGFRSSGLVVASKATFVTMGPLGFAPLACVAGVLWAATVSRKSPAIAYLSTIVLITVAALLTGRTHLPDQVLSMPDFGSHFFQFDLKGALSLSLLPVIFVIFITDLFDSVSTFVGVSQAGGLLDERGEPLRLREGLIVDAVATLTAGLFGSSSATAYIESAAGIRAGGRTGLTAVTVALLFLPCLFIGPLVSIVPPFATAPVLILVGLSMLSHIRDVEVKDVEIYVPAFLTALLIPFTFSITQGLLWGFVCHAILHIVVGKGRTLSTAFYVVALLCAGMLWIERG